MAINNSKLNIIYMAEELFVATKRNAQLRYEGYKKKTLHPKLGSPKGLPCF